MKKNLIILIKVICIFSVGYLTCFFLNKNRRNHQLVVKFNTKNHESYSEYFVNAVGLFYLYKKETANIFDLKNYIDTLSYYRKNLLIHHVTNEDYLIIYKPSVYKEYDNEIWGFSKDSFYVFEKRSILLKNYPIEYVGRGVEY